MDEMVAWSIDVLGVCLDIGRGNMLELVLDAVVAVDVAVAGGMLLVRTGTCP
jgi:hypothetical protein